MTNLVLLLFVYFIQNSCCTAIEIKIDAEDAIKLLRALAISPLFQNMKNFEKKPELTEYNNPYHPEDGILANTEVFVNTTHVTTTEYTEDAKLENENRKYNGKVSEEELADVADDANTKASLGNNSFQESTPNLDIVDSKNEIEEVTESFKGIKRRFSIEG